MAKRKVDPDQFTNLINDRIRGYEGYHAEMRVWCVPAGSKEPWGYDFDRAKFPDMAALVSKAYHELSAEYEVVV